MFSATVEKFCRNSLYLWASAEVSSRVQTVCPGTENARMCYAGNVACLASDGVLNVVADNRRRLKRSPPGTVALCSADTGGLSRWACTRPRPKYHPQQHHSGGTLLPPRPNCGWLRSTVGRTPVFGRRTDPPTLGLQPTGDHYVDKPSTTGQPTRPTQPLILSGSINE